MGINIKTKWWIVKIDGEVHCISYRNPPKLITYLRKKVYRESVVELIREATLEDYNYFHYQNYGKESPNILTV